MRRRRVDRFDEKIKAGERNFFAEREFDRTFETLASVENAVERTEVARQQPPPLLVKFAMFAANQRVNDDDVALPPAPDDARKFDRLRKMTLFVVVNSESDFHRKLLLRAERGREDENVPDATVGKYNV